MVDGGKGQLNVAVEVLRDARDRRRRRDRLAKMRGRARRARDRRSLRSDERVFLPGRKNPVVLARNSTALFLLQRVPLTRHTASRSRTIASCGRRRTPALRARGHRRASVPSGAALLLRHFGSLKRLRAASAEARIAAVPGIPSRLAAEGSTKPTRRNADAGTVTRPHRAHRRQPRRYPLRPDAGDLARLRRPNVGMRAPKRRPGYAARLLPPFAVGWPGGRRASRRRDRAAVLAVAGAVAGGRRIPSPQIPAARARRRPRQRGMALAAARRPRAILAQLPTPSDPTSRGSSASPIVGRRRHGRAVRGSAAADACGLAHTFAEQRAQPAAHLSSDRSPRSHAWRMPCATGRVGSGLRIVGRLRRPHTFANPGAYDHAGALRRRGIRATIFLRDEASIATRYGSGRDHRSRRSPASQPRGARIARRADEPVRGYLTAVLLGATQSLDAETHRALTRRASRTSCRSRDSTSR